MKSLKKMFFAGLLMTGFIFSITAYNASADCPNGCLDNGDGCWCHQWYPCYKEAGGGGPVIV